MTFISVIKSLTFHDFNLLSFSISETIFNNKTAIIKTKIKYSTHIIITFIINKCFDTAVTAYEINH